MEPIITEAPRAKFRGDYFQTLHPGRNSEGFSFAEKLPELSYFGARIVYRDVHARHTNTLQKICFSGETL